ncbi:MAG: tetratricopeptide repeat protein [Deltaproteobacteria bacterium]|nr:tetratricopeptide repeat protein [Deltaproteobacteria bacterium]
MIQRPASRRCTSTFRTMVRRAALLFGSLFSACLVGGWLLYHPDNVLSRLFRSEISDPKAKVIIGPYPTLDDFKLLKSHQVTTIISLLDPTLPYESALIIQERALARYYNMRFYSYPMSSVLGIGYGTEYTRHAREAANVVMHADGKVYLHCYLGLHRVKVVQAILASLGGSYGQYRLHQPEREPSLRLMDSAQAYFDAGEYQRALNQINLLPSRGVKLTLLRGWSLYRLGHIGDAAKSFRQALMQSNSESEAYSGLGYCSLNQNRLAEAEQNFREVLKIRTADPAALIGLGIIRYRRGQNTEAANYLEKGLASGEPDPEAEEILRKLIHDRTNRERRVPYADQTHSPGPRNQLKAGA